MADILAQFDIVERAEQARTRRGGAGGEGGGLGLGGDASQVSTNPFDDDDVHVTQELPSALELPSAMRVAR